MDIRPYEGDGEDAAQLMRRVWTKTYLGEMWFPLWSPEFLRWQFGKEDRQLCLAVYDANKLVGCFFSVRHSLRIRSTVFPMSFSSWFTIDHDYRLPRLGLDLIEALRRRHRETGQALSLGVVSGDPSSVAHLFWSKYSKACPQNFRFISKFGSWVKILNAPVMARAGIDAWERWGVRLLGPVLKRSPWGHDSHLRPYQSGDLGACARLLDRATSSMDWAVVWSEQQLTRQLEGPIPRSLVFERDGEVQGVVNYHHMQWQGLAPIRIALIDLWATAGLNHFEVSRLLGSVCHHLRGEDVDAVVCLRSSMFPTAALVANVFVALPASNYLVALFPQPHVPLEPPKTWSLLLR
jgi:N-myristoyl transferase